MNNALLIREANSDKDMIQIWKMVHDNYVEEGYIQPTIDGLFREYENYNSRIIIVEHEEVIVGTVSMCHDQTIGLPHEINFPTEVAELKQQHANLGSIYRIHTIGDDNTVVQQLFTRVIEILCEDYWEKYTAVFHPKHYKFYAKIFGMKKIVEQHCNEVNAPGILMLGDAKITQDKWNRILKRRSLPILQCEHWI